MRKHSWSSHFWTNNYVLLLYRHFSCRLLYEIYTLTVVFSLSTINISMLVEIFSWRTRKESCQPLDNVIRITVWKWKKCCLPISLSRIRIKCFLNSINHKALKRCKLRKEAEAVKTVIWLKLSWEDSKMFSRTFSAKPLDRWSHKSSLTHTRKISEINLSKGGVSKLSRKTCCNVLLSISLLTFAFRSLNSPAQNWLLRD